MNKNIWSTVKMHYNQNGETKLVFGGTKRIKSTSSILMCKAELTFIHHV